MQAATSSVKRAGRRRCARSLGLCMLGWLPGTAARALAQCTPAELAAPGASAGDQLGVVLATSGAWLAAGAPGDAGAGAQAGAVQLFERGASGWQPSARLVASDAGPGARFGAALALRDGRLLVGAPGAAGGAGAVYVFESGATGWVESVRLMASDAAPGQRFGAALAAAKSSDELLIGAPGHGPGGAGKAYLFELVGGAWTATHEFVAGAPAPAQAFGAALAIEGAQVLIGAPGDGLDGPRSGSVSHFIRLGASWSRWGNLAGHAQPGDAFGSALAISRDGTHAIAGAPGSASSSHGGRAWALILGKSGFTLDLAHGPLEAGLASGSRFGSSVAIDVRPREGEWRYAVGAPGADAEAGRAFAFELLADWFESAQLVASAPGPAHAGSSVALDDSTLASGAPGAAGTGLVLVCDDLPDFDCGDSGTTCAGLPNSSGNVAHLVASLDSPSEGLMTLFVDQAPAGRSGVFLTGVGQARLPFGDGLLCIDPMLGLWQLSAPRRTDGAGRAALTIDLDPPPMGLFAPFSSWRFQFLFRDPGGPLGSGFNLSDALGLTFCPP